MKDRKMNKKVKILLSTLLVLLIVVGSALGGSYLYARKKLSAIAKVDIPKDPAQLGIDTSKVSSDSSITNILLMGIDSRDPNADPGHTDSLMILTVDKKNNKVKLTSIMRDSLVNIDGYKPQKITNAHQFGGPLLTIKTVNENYDMDIKDFIQVNFFGLEKIIDSIGGVPINVAADEIPIANQYIDETSSLEHVTPKHITKAGLQTLSGVQAVGYCRIRYVGNNDFQRTERQRTVLTAIIKKLSSDNVTDIPKVMDTIAPYIQTSMKPNDIMSLATYAFTHGMTNLEQSRVPYDGMWNSAVIDGADVLTWDKQPTIQKMHQFIFGDSSSN